MNLIINDHSSKQQSLSLHIRSDSSLYTREPLARLSWQTVGEGFHPLPKQRADMESAPTMLGGAYSHKKRAGKTHPFNQVVFLLYIRLFRL